MKEQFKEQMKNLIVNQIFNKALERTDKLGNHDIYLSIQNIKYIIDQWEEAKARNKELGIK